MILEKPAPLAALAARQPVFVRPLLRSVLCIDELEGLYDDARKQNPEFLAQEVLNRLGIKVCVDAADLAKIPASGPAVVVANHPFGLLDGLILHSILKRARSDIKTLANEIACGLVEFADSFIPVDVFAPRGCVQNVSAVRAAWRWLSDGHAIATFPAGTVSHWNQSERRVTDPSWNTFPVRCALAVHASVAPVYFEGRNSFTFQLAGLVHPQLRTARLPKELLKKRGSTIRVRIGTPITYEELVRAGDEARAVDHVRARVYLLRNRAAAPNAFARLSSPLIAARKPQIQKAVGPPIKGVAVEIQKLEQEGRKLVENESYAVYGEAGHRVPLLLSEIARLRELTFREVQEGTGNHIDSDEFDVPYTHLILWHKPTACVAGSYRLAWTADMAQCERGRGLYTSTLFRYAPEFFSRIGPSVEAGRSFITRQHQREYAALLLLWQGIGRAVAARPDSPVLFGAVSISAEYPQAARELIVQFLRERSFREDLSPFVSPRRAFRPHRIQQHELNSITRCLQDIDDIPISELGAHERVPVLLRQYLRLGGKVAAFNVDSHFSNVLDALLVLDLRLTPRKLLTRYMGAEVCEAFLNAATN